MADPEEGIVKEVSPDVDNEEIARLKKRFVNSQPTTGKVGCKTTTCSADKTCSDLGPMRSDISHALALQHYLWRKCS